MENRLLRAQIGKNIGGTGAETLGISSGDEIDKRGPENEAALWATMDSAYNFGEHGTGNLSLPEDDICEKMVLPFGFGQIHEAFIGGRDAMKLRRQK